MLVLRLWLEKGENRELLTGIDSRKIFPAILLVRVSRQHGAWANFGPPRINEGLARTDAWGVSGWAPKAVHPYTAPYWPLFGFFLAQAYSGVLPLSSV